jgi:hypothetical protein
MRRGYHDLWKYDGFPANAEVVSIDGEQIPLEELPGTFVEREYDRQFPSYDPPATDNEVSLARFHKVSGKGHKVTKVVENAGTTMTRREETYERLAAKMRGNKWFDDNA